jgi:hypothetical protein
MVDIALIASITSATVLAIGSSITAPAILLHRTEKMHKQDREAEWARQDQAAADLIASQKVIADKAAEAAELLLASNRESIQRTDEVARVAEATASRTDAKLDQLDLQTKRIHILVNSDMTAARQAQLDQARIMVLTLERVIRLAKDRGQDPDPRDVEELTEARENISNLEGILADRLSQMRQVEAEQIINPIKG